MYTHFIAYHKVMAAATSPEAAIATKNCLVTTAPESPPPIVGPEVGAILMVSPMSGSMHPHVVEIAAGSKSSQTTGLNFRARGHGPNWVSENHVGKRNDLGSTASATGGKCGLWYVVHSVQRNCCNNRWNLYRYWQKQL
jgi:hypothetical protein